MAELGHDHIDLLKISAEGSEYEILDHVVSESIDVRVLCVEYAQPAPLERVLESIEQPRVGGLRAGGRQRPHLELEAHVRGLARRLSRRPHRRRQRGTTPTTPGSDRRQDAPRTHAPRHEQRRRTTASREGAECGAAALVRTPHGPALRADPGDGLVTLGSDYGGWTIPDVVEPSWTCYCVGAGGDISFERELIGRYGATARSFEPDEDYIRRAEVDPEHRGALLEAPGGGGYGRRARADAADAHPRQPLAVAGAPVRHRGLRGAARPHDPLADGRARRRRRSSC